MAEKIKYDIDYQFLDGKQIIDYQPIPIIRAAWGTKKTGLQNLLNEINNKCFRFPFEHVYVWGREALDALESMGYVCTLVSDEPFTEGMDYTNYMHYKKLIASSMAFEHFGEHLLLDWDCSLSLGHVNPNGSPSRVWELDENWIPTFPKKFWNLCRRNEVSMPMYVWWNRRKYFAEGEDIDKASNLSDIRGNKILTPMQECNTQMRSALNAYGWNWRGMKMIPNACWMYTKGNINIGLELLDIMFKKDIRANVEEICMKIWADCSIDEYIQKYHPLCIYGKHGMYGNMSSEETEFNNYIKEKLPDFDEILFHY